ncbi:MAG: hypothetical protein E6J84_14885 [Deltaproteobacteria bacterium]|nr:MAG: hypothetical protein E6J84_14885 [Deltaproteobacteria bacterium]
MGNASAEIAEHDAAVAAPAAALECLVRQRDHLLRGDVPIDEDLRNVPGQLGRQRLGGGDSGIAKAERASHPLDAVHVEVLFRGGHRSQVLDGAHVRLVDHQVVDVEEDGLVAGLRPRDELLDDGSVGAAEEHERPVVPDEIEIERVVEDRGGGETGKLQLLDLVVHPVPGWMRQRASVDEEDVPVFLASEELPAPLGNDPAHELLRLFCERDRPVVHERVESLPQQDDHSLVALGGDMRGC